MAMTIRQKLMKLFYPLLVWAQQKSARKKILVNRQGAVPSVLFHSLSVTLNNGQQMPFEVLRGKKVLLVNTASNCGYTAQYAELQKLYEHTKDQLTIIAFPTNDFKAQEKGTDEDIAAFCSVNFGVQFPLARKVVVAKTEEQHLVYQWLTSRQMNGWNEKLPSWNFAKYLVDEEGVLTHYFEPAVSPVDEEVIKAVQS
jgi:glutathione peroxidase